GADYRVHFRNILLNLVSKAFYQAAGYNQALGLAGGLVTRHFKDGIDRFLLGAGDKGTGVDDDHVGIFGRWSQLSPGLRQNAHHDLAIDEVLGAAQAYKADFEGSRRRASSGDRFSG